MNRLRQPDRPKKKPEYSYWRWSWQKWAVLLAGVLMALSLWSNFSEYQRISAAEPAIFSAEQFAAWQVERRFACSLNGFGAALLFGALVVGERSRCKADARMGEGILMLVLTLGWGAAGLVFDFSANQRLNLCWAALLAACLIGSLYSFWDSRRQRSK